jgi:hypothetical protein
MKISANDLSVIVKYCNKNIVKRLKKNNHLNHCENEHDY